MNGRPHPLTRFPALLALALATPLLAAEEFRFPQPDFDAAYTIPSPTRPGPRPAGFETLDVALLILALAAAAFFVLRLRSRRATLWLMLGCLAYFGFYRKGCICPVGSIQNVALSLGTGAYPIPIAVAIFFAAPLLAALLFGRVFCAAVCPLGAIQDVAVWRPVRVPAWIAVPLGFLPKIYLGVAIAFAATGSAFLICRYDPFVSLFRLDGPAPMITAGIVLLALGLFVARPYCRFLCPYGVLLGWLSSVAWRHPTVTPKECVQCRLCEASCPFDAIEPPSGSHMAEPRPRGLRRLAFILAITPALAALGAWLGHALGGPLAELDRTVYTARLVVAEERAHVTVPQTKETEAFRGAGRSVPELLADATAVERRIRTATLLAGALVGLLLGAELARLASWRRREDYTPNRMTCLACARCYAHCPIDTRNVLPEVAERYARHRT